MLPQDDLQAVVMNTGATWEQLRGGRLFITGGTGFFGRWLLETFLAANAKLELGAYAVILTRDRDAARRSQPHLAGERALEFLVGDVRDFEMPTGEFSHVIHAATDASAQLNNEDPTRMLDVISDGTRRVLEFAVRAGARRFLLASSGAVYGRQPADLSHIPEEYNGAPDAAAPSSAYGEGKRMAELLCACFHKQHGLQAVIARCFAFVGPGLPLDSHFAIGNFLGDALAARPIRVKGNGSPVRSYLYAADLATWLWRLLFLGRAGTAYNVGSDRDISVAETAQQVAASQTPPLAVEYQNTASIAVSGDRYVPSTRRAAEGLGLTQTIDLTQAIRKTLAWHRRNAS